MAEPGLFADYRPREPGTQRGLPPADLLIRPAQPPDGDGLASLISQREGHPFAEVQARRVHELSSPPAADRLLLVAVQGTQVIAFGRAKQVKSVLFTPGEPTGPVPEGWYLTGLIVDPAWRRCGLGAGLTRSRLNWIAQRANVAYYFAKSLNLASIDLHRHLGFAQVQYDFHFPGAHFSGGGVGILFSARAIARISATPT